jgi:hypothetical protein
MLSSFSRLVVWRRLGRVVLHLESLLIASGSSHRGGWAGEAVEASDYGAYGMAGEVLGHEREDPKGSATRRLLRCDSSCIKVQEISTEA